METRDHYSSLIYALTSQAETENKTCHDIMFTMAKLSLDLLQHGSVLSKANEQGKV